MNEVKSAAGAKHVDEKTAGTKKASAPKSARREIPGNLPYTQAPGKLAEALQNLISAERPQKFNKSFLDSVLKIKGGSAAPIPPILKKCGLLNSDNSPTELYSKFKSDSSRPNAALASLKGGFSEIFKRNDYAHKLNDDRIVDIIIEITGLSKNDSIVRSILGTYNAFKEYAKDASDEKIVERVIESKKTEDDVRKEKENPGEFNLINTINVVLPETTDVEVYNAIFKSIRENLVR